MKSPGREATKDYSKGHLLDRVPLAVLRGVLAGVAVTGAALLIVAEFTTLVEVVVGSLQTVQRRVEGGENHDYALLVIALASLPLAWLMLKGHRAAAVGLGGLGIAALLVALAIDLPDTSASGTLPEDVAFEDARTRAGPGLHLELLGAAALLASGALAWTLAEAQRRRERGRR